MTTINFISKLCTLCTILHDSILLMDKLPAFSSSNVFNLRRTVHITRSFALYGKTHMFWCGCQSFTLWNVIINANTARNSWLFIIEGPRIVIRKFWQIVAILAWGRGMVTLNNVPINLGSLLKFLVQSEFYCYEAKFRKIHLIKSLIF